MAQASVELIDALRLTASRIERSDSYEWGHMGSCNCGHLAQTITKKSRAEIHEEALKRYGDWNQQLIDFCAQSGLPIDHIIEEMLAIGLTRQDLMHLEKLSDPRVLQHMPPAHRHPRHNASADVVLYMRTWADMLERQLLATLDLPVDITTLSYAA